MPYGYPCANTYCLNTVDEPGKLCPSCNKQAQKHPRKTTDEKLKELEQKPRGGREWLNELQR